MKVIRSYLVIKTGLKLFIYLVLFLSDIVASSPYQLVALMHQS